jgi:sirohydrochlorin ferrochelatase
MQQAGGLLSRLLDTVALKTGPVAMEFADRNEKTALLLIAHGSRQQEANLDLHDLVGQLRARRVYAIVEASFLDLAEPSILEGGKNCVAQGAGNVILLPYFLSAGVHVRRDLTEARRVLSERFPQVSFALADPLGPHPLLIEVVLERAREARPDEQLVPAQTREGLLPEHTLPQRP